MAIGAVFGAIFMVLGIVIVAAIIMLAVRVWNYADPKKRESQVNPTQTFNPGGNQ